MVVTNLSKHTHIQPETIDITPDKLDAYVSETLESVDKFFIVIRESKAAVSEAFIDKIYDEIINLVTSETLGSIDEIATHYAIDEVSIDEVLVDFIDNEHVELTITGTICAELQFGSNSDMRCGDGITLDHSFPFSCRLRSEVGNPGVFPYGPENFEVSNDDWYE